MININELKRELFFKPNQWTGKTVVCIAGGCSLTQEQVDMVKDKGYKVIAINDAYKIAPWANILYACDNQWWEWHNGCPEFKGKKFTHEQGKRWEAYIKGEKIINPPYAGADWVVVSDGVSGYSYNPSRIKHGSNSGYQALHIAISFGASKIILLGYDMHAKTGVSHWFGEHPNGKQRDSRYAEWIEEFPALQEAALNKSIEIVNCTPGSALDCFVKMELKDVI